MSSAPPAPIERRVHPRPPDAGAPGNRRMTLRAKGLLALGALVAYIVLLAGVFVEQQDRLMLAFDELTRMRKVQSDLHAIGLSLARAAAGAHAASSRLDGGARGGRWLLDVDQVIETARALQRDRDEMNSSLDALSSATATFRADRSRENLTALERVLDESAGAFADAYARVAAWEEARSNAVRRQAQAMVVTMLIVGLLGIALIAVVVVQFFARMATDLRLLRRSAIDVVFGRGGSLPVERPDEVGELMATINQLGSALAQRERELELERGRRFHNDKMAAVGALAAGVITEIGNPLAAIDGYARALKETPGLDEGALRDVDAILEQTARLVTVTRDIAALSEHHRSERELVDINAIVKDAVRLIHYDPRFRADRIDVALDTNVPAVPGMADRLLQLVLSLIGNAMEGGAAYSASAPRIRMATFAAPDGAVLQLDTGAAGTKSESMVFTDISAQEAGPGLSLCRSIVDEHGGSLRVETNAQGARVRATFPYAEEALAVEN